MAKQKKENGKELKILISLEVKWRSTMWSQMIQAPNVDNSLPLELISPQLQEKFVGHVNNFTLF